jgi:hypothetical protein
MGEAAAAWLATLTADQKAKACFEVSDQAVRTRWYYTPNLRKGLPLSEMTRAQERLAQKLLGSGLSRAGYFTATTIMGLEPALDRSEGYWRPDYGRDPRRYYVSLFGTPSETAPWGWRFEGHHVSLNYTIVGGQVVSPTPTFFGSNPADSPLGASAFLRPLAGVEDTARELVRSLDEGQRAKVILAPAAPPDIIQCNRATVEDGAVSLPPPLIQDEPMTEAEAERARKFRAWLGYTAEHEEALRYTNAPKGLAASALTQAQRQMLGALLAEYVHRMPDELAQVEADRLHTDGLDQVHFAWAGSLERGKAHYYRLQAPRFLVEYDKAQDDANHIHTVWRDPTNDFGLNVLAEHYATSH